MTGRLRLAANRDVCIGSGLCVTADDSVFDQDDDGIVVIIDDQPADNEIIRNAVRNCPSGALQLLDETADDD